MSLSTTKPTKSVRPAKTQISLGICPVLSESSGSYHFKLLWQTSQYLLCVPGISISSFYCAVHNIILSLTLVLYSRLLEQTD